MYYETRQLTRTGRHGRRHRLRTRGDFRHKGLRPQRPSALRAVLRRPRHGRLVQRPVLEPRVPEGRRQPVPPAPEARLVLLPLAAGHVDDDGPARVADVDEVLVRGGAPGRDEGRRVRDRVDEAELAQRRGGQEPRARLVEDPPHVARRQQAVEAVLRVRRAPVGRARGLQDGDRARRLVLGGDEVRLDEARHDARGLRVAPGVLRDREEPDRVEAVDDVRLEERDAPDQAEVPSLLYDVEHAGLAPRVDRRRRVRRGRGLDEGREQAPERREAVGRAARERRHQRDDEARDGAVGGRGRPQVLEQVGEGRQRALAGPGRAPPPGREQVVRVNEASTALPRDGQDRRREVGHAAREAVEHVAAGAGRVAVLAQAPVDQRPRDVPAAESAALALAAAIVVLSQGREVAAARVTVAELPQQIRVAPRVAVLRPRRRADAWGQ